MLLDTIIGNKTVKHALKTALLNNKLPHAVLISAPTGCGRGFVARCLAADFLYPNNPTSANLVFENQNPEFIVIQGEGKSGQIPVESIRLARKEIHRSSLSANGRVILIKDAHKMASPAANALLKALEEPPANVLFILTTEDVSTLPLTIASRCALYTLTPAPLQECKKLLEENLSSEQEKNLPEILANVYNGRIGICMKVLQNQARLATLKDAFKISKAAAQKNTYTLLCLFAKYEGRADGDRQLRETLLSDATSILECALVGANLPNAYQFTPFTSTKLLPLFLQAQEDLQKNALPKLVFSKLCVLISRI